MASLKSLSPSEFIALANAIAFALIDGKNAADTIIIGELISLVGDIIVTDGAQKSRLELAASAKNKGKTQKIKNSLEETAFNTQITP